MQTFTTHNCLRQGLTLRLPGRNGESGQSLVELALTMPLLLLILLGAVELGKVAYAAIEVSDAAMAAAQYGAQNSTTAGDTTGIQTAASNDVPDLSLGTTTSSLACICSDGSPSTCQSTDCTGSHIETILTVQTQTSFNPGFHLPGLGSTFTLRGRAVRKILQ